MKKYNANSGWFQESSRHSLSARGVRTGKKCDYSKMITPPSKIITRTTTKYMGDDFEFTFEPVDGSMSITQLDDGTYEAKYLVRDDNPQSPDENRDDGAFLVHYHRDFDVRKDKIITEDDARTLYQGGKIPQQKEYWIMPVSALIHSGVWLRLGHSGFAEDSGGWDTSHVGLVLLSKKEWKSKKKAEKYAEGLIEEWNSYLSGDVYGIVVDKYDKDKKLIDNDSTWGYSGYKYAMEELKGYEPTITLKTK